MDHSQHATAIASSQELPGGLLISKDGYTLEAPTQLPAAAAIPLSFRILGRDGAAALAYDKAHDKDLHLIAVRRDLTGFQHVHPELAADGIWSVPVSLTPGTWRLFADFHPSGHSSPLVLGADVAVAGNFQPRPLPAPAATAEVEDYIVALQGELVADQPSMLTVSVTQAGQPVTDLQPYLAAYGHLVALREGDLAYLHVHPMGEPGDGTTPAGPDVVFHASAPAGLYRLFFDFQHGDVVRTAEFTVRAATGTGTVATHPAAGHGGGHHH